MTRDDVLKKIRKLLALADDNANEHEAVAAALKAQKLIAEHDVKRDELGEDEDEIIELRTEEFVQDTWRKDLAGTIANAFRCRCFASRHSDGLWNVKHSCTFVGRSCDANAAKLVYEKLVKVGHELMLRECRSHREMCGHCRGVKNSFLVGFVWGVDDELQKQVEALMLVTPREVNDYFDEIAAERGFGKRPAWTVRAEIDASGEGRTAGRDAVRAGRMDGADERLLAAAV